MNYNESVNLRIKSFELAKEHLDTAELSHILKASEIIYNYLAENKINSSAD